MPGKGPYKMKGSPHKLGTIEGTEVHKASMAKAKAFAVEQTRTSGDPSLVTAGSELGSSYIPASIDYGIETGFKTDSKGKKKKDPPTEEEQTAAYVEKELAEAHEGKYGKGLFGGYLRRGRARGRYKRSGHSLGEETVESGAVDPIKESETIKLHKKAKEKKKKRKTVKERWEEKEIERLKKGSPSWDVILRETGNL